MKSSKISRHHTNGEKKMFEIFPEEIKIKHFDKNLDFLVNCRISTKRLGFSEKSRTVKEMFQISEIFNYVKNSSISPNRVILKFA